MSWKGVIDKYHKFLPVSDNTPIVSLNEGNTPLILAKNLKVLAQTLQLDIFGIDCASTQDNELIIFEVNASMTASNGQDAQKWPYLAKPTQAIKLAFQLMIKEKAENALGQPTQKKQAKGQSKKIDKKSDQKTSPAT